MWRLRHTPGLWFLAVARGETEPRAVGEHDVRRLPNEFHLFEGSIAQPLMGDAERVEADDAGGLAPRLPGRERHVDPQVCAVDRVAERIEEGGVALERAHRLGAFVLICESERDVVP